LCADLPALRPYDLEDALLATPRTGALPTPSFVSDAAGLGTTMFVAQSLEAFRPSFGAGSRQAHLAQGAVEIPPPGLASLRRDVDTPEDLRAAAELGVGPRTSWVITRRGLLPS
jgi:2-phospho-L-lactate guanylyltransferase